MTLELHKNLRNQNRMTRTTATPFYAAPEMFWGNYTEKCDIWAIGVIMFILLSGTQPFGGNYTQDICEAVMNGDYEFNSDKWDKISQNAKDIISDMLTYDHNKRKSASELLEHEWFKKYDAGEIEQKSLKSALSSLK